MPKIDWDGFAPIAFLGSVALACLMGLAFMDHQRAMAKIAARSEDQATHKKILDSLKRIEDVVVGRGE